MTKRRIIGTLILRDGIVVQSIGFERYLPVGRPEIAARFLDTWGIDEIVLLDITARREGRTIDPETVSRVARAIHSPLTIGGGLSTLDDVHDVMRAGADKIAVNGLLLEKPDMLTTIAHRFGVQCIVASIDVLRTDDGLHVAADGARQILDDDPVTLARRAAEAGAGEILLNAVHRDGMRTGYDLELVDMVAGAVHVPVIALGGAGHPDHIREVLADTGAAAAAAGNFLHYTEHSVAAIKTQLVRHGLDVRLDAEADYGALQFDDGRVSRRDERALLDEIFEIIPREVI